MIEGEDRRGWGQYRGKLWSFSGLKKRKTYAWKGEDELEPATRTPVFITVGRTALAVWALHNNVLSERLIYLRANPTYRRGGTGKGQDAQQ